MWAVCSSLPLLPAFVSDATLLGQKVNMLQVQSCQEKRAGFLLQWGLQFIRLRSCSCTWCEQKYLQCFVFWTVLVTSARQWRHPVSCRSYSSLSHYNSNSYSRHVMENQSQFLCYHSAYIQWGCICLSSFHPAFCSQLHSVGTGWTWFMSRFYCWCVSWGTASFWPSQPNVSLTGTTEVQPYVTEDDPE